MPYDSSGLYKPGFIPFSERQWNDYKQRLAVTVAEEGVSCEELSTDPEAQQFVKNYADTNFTDPTKTEELRQKGITLKFAVMNISTNRGDFNYPIINEYKGHHIYRTGYFSREANQSLVMKYIDVVPTNKIELLT